MKYKTKPIIVDAFQVIASEGVDNLSELKEWVESFGDDYDNHFKFIDQGPDGGSLLLYNDVHYGASVYSTEYLVRVNLEGLIFYYRYKEKDFLKNYEPAN